MPLWQGKVLARVGMGRSGYFLFEIVSYMFFLQHFQNQAPVYFAAIEIHFKSYKSGRDILNSLCRSASQRNWNICGVSSSYERPVSLGVVTVSITFMFV